jgi:hypothetical protein
LIFKIYFQINESKKKVIKFNETAIKRIQDIEWADIQLYNYFSAKFSKLIEKFGKENMNRELNELKHKTQIKQKHCSLHKNNLTCHMMGTLAGASYRRLLDRQKIEFPGTVLKLQSNL